MIIAYVSIPEQKTHAEAWLTVFCCPLASILAVVATFMIVGNTIL